jgi:hypothetical protein
MSDSIGRAMEACVAAYHRAISRELAAIPAPPEPACKGAPCGMGGDAYEGGCYRAWGSDSPCECDHTAKISYCSPECRDKARATCKGLPCGEVHLSPMPYLPGHPGWVGEHGTVLSMGDRVFCSVGCRDKAKPAKLPDMTFQCNSCRKVVGVDLDLQWLAKPGASQAIKCPECGAGHTVSLEGGTPAPAPKKSNAALTREALDAPLTFSGTQFAPKKAEAWKCPMPDCRTPEAPRYANPTKPHLGGSSCTACVDKMLRSMADRHDTNTRQTPYERRQAAIAALGACAPVAGNAYALAQSGAWRRPAVGYVPSDLATWWED